ncbi:ead/Ea22-like family protein [Cronobacter turicensis]|uniref:ead/Ea22-like family protein n=1 Tax=Cronobacter turicensis TaxID=413502 RepID=UPI003570F0EE
MTDTAKLKAAALAATPGPWVEARGEVTTADYEVDGGIYLDHICNCEIIGTESPNAEFIALANPAAVLDLIAALEAKDARIAELEARTVSVKLPEPATEGGRGYRQKVIWALQGAFFDAGINLETGGEA